MITQRPVTGSLRKSAIETKTVGSRLWALGFGPERAYHAVRSKADFNTSTFSLPDSSRVTATTSKRQAMSDSRFMNKYDMAMRLSRFRFCHGTESKAGP